MHELFNSVWNKEDFPGSGRSRSLYLSIRRLVKQTVVIIVPCLLVSCLQKIVSSILLSRFTPYVEEILVWILTQQVNY